MRFAVRSAVVAGLAVASGLVLAPAAFAHARVSPAVSLAGKLQLYSLAIPTEKENLTTAKIVLTVPQGFGIDSFVPAPGWTQQIQQTGSGDSAVVQKVTWTGGHVPTGEDSLFQFLAQPAHTGRTRSRSSRPTPTARSSTGRVRVVRGAGTHDPGRLVDGRRQRLDTRDHRHRPGGDRADRRRCGPVRARRLGREARAGMSPTGPGCPSARGGGADRACGAGDRLGARLSDEDGRRRRARSSTRRPARSRSPTTRRSSPASRSSRSRTRAATSSRPRPCTARRPTPTRWSCRSNRTCRPAGT